MSFISELFCAIRNGRLSRLRFLVCYIATFALSFLFFCLICIPLFLLFDPIESFNIVTTVLDIPIMVFGIALLLASANIVAKRFRDMGLPGWGMFIMHIFIVFIVNIIFDDDYLAIVELIINLPIFLCLFFIPTNFFNSKA
ncbi:TPA: DUF805 domain-containing protein [Yersinia enterocolitica]|uniref:DUF805 domain-containing protein n=1 Tax=Yersinia enterocolitica TaxID=630 RepID=UPI003301E228|nr:DUF805 domain-containing protein [Yersinia enterocolitica]EKN4809059.1 DUF805 domain-containing protein [Yersinia enterocolitica]HDL7328441.1 DUF805 domain-containing protein [Yersinia enterocolitica]HDL7354668.1 DUF805 domain-containing protein [Yersinia enterocolitica]HDL7958284.1 DUF805 domain-containing protein [Yersinia enterocolitica]